MIQVGDTHRLPYQRALIRAWSNIAKTEAAQFFNVTDPDVTPDSAIGYIVKTNAAGYLYTMDNTEISCLAVRVPAIIEVSLDNGASWLIQWITGTRQDATISAADIHKLYYHDEEGELVAYDPLAADSTLPDYALKSDLDQGQWAEGTQEIDGDTPTNLVISKWTHSIYNSVDRSNDIFIIAKGAGREGQVIAVTNGYAGSKLRIRTTYGTDNTETVLDFKDVVTLVRCDDNGWIASKVIPDSVEPQPSDLSQCVKRVDMTDGMAVPAEASAIYNTRNIELTDLDGNLSLSPRTVVFSDPYGGIVAIKPNNGRANIVRPANVTIQYSETVPGTKTYKLDITANGQITGVINPAFLYVLTLSKTDLEWPQNASWWGSHLGYDENLYIKPNFILASGVKYTLIIRTDYLNAAESHAGRIRIGSETQYVTIFESSDKSWPVGIIVAGSIERRDIISAGTIQASYLLWEPIQVADVP